MNFIYKPIAIEKNKQLIDELNKNTGIKTNINKYDYCESIKKFTSLQEEYKNNLNIDFKENNTLTKPINARNNLSNNEYFEKLIKRKQLINNTSKLLNEFKDVINKYNLKNVNYKSYDNFIKYNRLGKTINYKNKEYYFETYDSIISINSINNKDTFLNGCDNKTNIKNILKQNEKIELLDIFKGENLVMYILM